jgi:hypothetical protein
MFFAPAPNVALVAGTFNGWRPEANSLERKGSGERATRLMPRSGQYEYRFVGDGAWADDLQAMQRARNLHGALNSVLEWDWTTRQISCDGSFPRPRSLLRPPGTDANRRRTGIWRQTEVAIKMQFARCQPN